MPIYARSDSAWNQMDPLYVKVDGSWVLLSEVYARDALGWNRVYTAEVVMIAPNDATLLSASTYFNNVSAGLWASAKKKRLIVNGVRGPITIPTAFGGRFVLEVQEGGAIGGLGGVPNVDGSGGKGGNAVNITDAMNVIIENNGIIRGGGGSGGKGGTGGTGGDPLRQPLTGYYYDDTDFPPNAYTYAMATIRTTLQKDQVVWGGDMVFNGNRGGGGNLNYPLPHHVAPWTYYADTTQQEHFNQTYVYGVYRVHDTDLTPNAGGVGGAGGRGRGADGAPAAGAFGVAGGPGSGNGGRGGTGAEWGLDGSAGNTGGSGTTGFGQAGLSGGAAGKAIHGYNRVSSYSGSGTLVGGTDPS